MTSVRVLLWLILALGGFLPAPQAQPDIAARERAYRENNLGVARLEQFQYEQAAAAFREALRLDPELAMARLNLALALFYGGNPDAALEQVRGASAPLPAPHADYLLGFLARSRNEPREAESAFRRVLQRDPEDVATQVHLGQIYLDQQRYAEAIALFRTALSAEPYNLTAAYNLATALIRSGAADEGREAMQQFVALRKSRYGVAYSQSYGEQGRYAEAVASTGAEPELVDPNTPAARFVDATKSALPDAARAVAGTADTLPAEMAGSVTLFDMDGDSDLDLLDAGPQGVRLFRNDTGVFTDRSEPAGLSAERGAALAALAGDYDKDGRPDLFILSQAGNRLLRQTTDGAFESTVKLPTYAHAARSAAFTDVDHDGDLDIMVIGLAEAAAARRAAADGQAPADLPPAPNQLLRNNGDGTFSDITQQAGVGRPGHGLAIVPTDFDNLRDVDLLIVDAVAAPALLQNVRDGSFRDVARTSGLPGAERYTSVAAADANKDGYTDLFFGRAGAAGLFAMSNAEGEFTVSVAPEATAAARAAQFLDYDNDGLLDLAIVSARGAHLLRNLGTRWLDTSTAAGLDALEPRASAFHAAASGDVDGDGDSDLVVRAAGGDLRVWRNDGGNQQASVRVQLTGRVSNGHGVGAKIDVRAGSLRQRLETSTATPAVAPSDIVFGLGTRRQPDVVRVLWPSGTLQAETEFAPPATAPAEAGRANVVKITELDRKPSSCPYLYTWNGSRFAFVTDFLGGGELGYWSGPGQWNQPDPDEYVRIPAGYLEPRDGRYEIRITNELEEALFIDRVQLVAVDHPSDVEAYPNEGLIGAPRPPFAVTTVRDAQPPVGATDDGGRDVLPRLLAIDRRYADGFPLRGIRGYAEPHALTLDLGPDGGNAVLLFTGWTDYAFSGDNVAAHQAGLSLAPPSLQVKDAAGSWRTVIENIGIPVGRPQTVLVDLRGKVPAGTRHVRVHTNMRIYWDQVLVDRSGGGVSTSLTRLDPLSSDLRWRGFSAESSPDGREPYGYDYDRVSMVSPWKVMVGRYTREGDVQPLLTDSDDMFVVSRPGDEIAFSFDARALPPLRPGMTRTFLLYADGYSKEMDINSASPHTVEPLPFHGMTRYPYGPAEHYPQTAAHLEYLERYNTRTVSTPLPPIEIVK